MPSLSMYDASGRCQQAEETVKGVRVAGHGQTHEFRLIQSIEHLHMTSNVSALHLPRRRVPQRLSGTRLEGVTRNR